MPAASAVRSKRADIARHAQVDQGERALLISAALNLSEHPAAARLRITAMQAARVLAVADAATSVAA